MVMCAGCSSQLPLSQFCKPPAAAGVGLEAGNDEPEMAGDVTAGEAFDGVGGGVFTAD